MPIPRREDAGGRWWLATEDVQSLRKNERCRTIKVEDKGEFWLRANTYYDTYDELVADRISMALGGEVALRDPDFDGDEAVFVDDRRFAAIKFLEGENLFGTMLQRGANGVWSYAVDVHWLVRRVLDDMLSFYREHEFSELDEDVVRDVISRIYDEIDTNPSDASILAEVINEITNCLRKQGVCIGDFGQYVSRELSPVFDPPDLCCRYGDGWCCEEFVGCHWTRLFWEEGREEGRVCWSGSEAGGIKPEMSGWCDPRVVVLDGYKFDVNALSKLLKVEEVCIRNVFAECANIADVFARLPIKLPRAVLSGQLEIGNVRMAVEEWLAYVGWPNADLMQIAFENGATSWSANFVKGMVVVYVMRLAEESGADPEGVLAKVKSGYSIEQALGRCDGVPKYAEHVVLKVGGVRIQLQQAFREFGVLREKKKELLLKAIENGSFDVAHLTRWFEDRVDKQIERQKELKQKSGECEKSALAILAWRGESKTIDEWSKQTGIPVAAIKSRVSSRWSTEDVFGIPYPCGPTMKVEGRIYTEKMMLSRFGLSFDAMRKKMKEEAAAERKAAEDRAKEAKIRRDLEKREEAWRYLCAKGLTMAGESLTISEWMECLYVSREHFNGGDVRALVRSPQCDAIVRGILRSISKCGTNKAILEAVAKWQEGDKR